MHSALSIILWTFSALPLLGNHPLIWDECHPLIIMRQTQHNITSNPGYRNKGRGRWCTGLYRESCTVTMGTSNMAVLLPTTAHNPWMAAPLDCPMKNKRSSSKTWKIVDARLQNWSTKLSCWTTEQDKPLLFTNKAYVDDFQYFRVILQYVNCNNYFVSLSLSSENVMYQATFSTYALKFSTN